jgi:hypothetical protein
MPLHFVTGKIRAGSKGDFSDMDQKTLIEMKNQAKLWDRIDSKMEDKIKSLKATGTRALRCRVAVVFVQRECWCKKIPRSDGGRSDGGAGSAMRFLYTLPPLLLSAVPHCVTVDCATTDTNTVHGSHTYTGVIATENDEEQAEKYMLPAKRRWQALHDMLQFLVSELGA